MEPKEPKLVMIVDDDPVVCRVVERVLTGEGRRVVRASSSREAAATAVRERPDLVVLDVAMPGMDGYEVCRALRADPRTERIPIIMLTGMSAVPEIVEGLDSGADAYMTKPFLVQELTARANALLRRAASA